MTFLVDSVTTPARPFAARPAPAYPATRSAIDRGGLPWDDHQRAWILDLRERGLGAAAVAAALGRSVETIYAQYQLLGSRVFVRRTWSAADAARAIARAEAGEPLKVIAADHGRTLDQLRGMFETRGYRPRRRADWSDDELAMLRERLAAGDTCVVAGEALGRSAASVRQKASALGLELGRRSGPARGTRVRLSAAAPAAGRAAGGGGCRWDAAAEARLAALVASDGAGAIDAIAAALGSTPRMVRAKALALGLVPRKRARRGLTAAGIETARRLAPTTPVTAVSRALGCDVRTLKAWARAEGIGFAAAARVAETSAAPGAAVARRPRPAATSPPVARTTGPVPGSRTAALALAVAAAEASRLAVPAAAAGEPAGVAWARRVVPEAVTAKAATAARAEAARGVAAQVRYVAPAPPPDPKSRFRQYRRPARGKAAPDTATLLRDTGDAIAAFLATRGVTRVKLDPRAELEAAVRRRGYALVTAGAGYLVDGRMALDDVEALRRFAERRRIAA